MQVYISSKAAGFIDCFIVVMLSKFVNADKVSTYWSCIIMLKRRMLKFVQSEFP